MANFDKFGKFTKEAKQALLIAQESAREANLEYVGTEHLLIGILAQETSLGASVLFNFGVSLDNVRLVLDTVGKGFYSTSVDTDGDTGLSAYAKDAIEGAVKAAHEFGHSYIGTEHLLFSLVSQLNTAAVVIFENMKVSPSDVKEQILEIFEQARRIPNPTDSSAFPSATKNPKMMNPMDFFLNGLQGMFSSQSPKQGDNFTNQSSGSQSKTPALDYFTTDLVKEARDGKLPVVIGREAEIERIISILSRKTKNNPVLIGESGVGKTAVCEGLALAIVGEKVPDNMLDKRILSLSMAAVVAGTKYRGEFEERIKQILDEVMSQENVILFIDEFHTVMGAGSAEGSLDAANIIKPALSRGQVQVIGATTTNEFRKNIEKDAALERRFQSVMIEEPSDEQTIDILHGIRESFENHHNLIITDDALSAAIVLSKRYINDRFLPDKAIDLIDEASAKKRVRSGGRSDKLKKLQKKLVSTIKKKEASVARQDYEKAADFRTQEIELGNKITEQKTVKIPRSKRQKITENDISDIVSSMTGIPVTKLMGDEIKKLKSLDSLLKKRIIGQDEAVDVISKAIQRSRAGFADEKRPIGSFIFLGPTGVGKTELVKSLAEEFFNDPNVLIKIDMSEFMERHNASRLVGATAGYVGYDDGGQLTEAVRRKPYSIILFDEIEKAHPDVFNLLLQILEDGELTDAKGRKVDFKNTIIVMTSNIGAKKLTDKAAPIGFASSAPESERAEADFKDMQKQIMGDLKSHFRPEFLNRVDKVVIFHALKHNDIKEIVRLNLNYLQKRLDHKKLKLVSSPGAIEALSHLGFDPKYGARPVRRAIQDYIEDPLTAKFLDGDFKEGDTIRIVKKGDSVELVKVK